MAAGSTLAVRAMDVHSAEEFRDAVQNAAQPAADALRARAAPLKARAQVPGTLRTGMHAAFHAAEASPAGSQGPAKGCIGTKRLAKTGVSCNVLPWRVQADQ